MTGKKNNDFTSLSCAFQVTIYSSHLDYRVFVNGQQNHTYSHRYMKLLEIDLLEVSGDVQLSSVQASQGFHSAMRNACTKLAPIYINSYAKDVYIFVFICNDIKFD